MKKMLALFKISILEALEYRARGFIWSVLDVVPSLGMMLFWYKVFEQQSLINGQTRSELVGYYLISSFVVALLVSHPEYMVSQLINKGDLSGFLLKPISNLTFWFLSEIAYKVNRLFFVLPGFLLLQLLAWHLLDGMVSISITFPVIVILFNSVIIIYLIKAMIGLSAFWFSEIGWIIGVNDLINLLFSGILLPLYLYPSWFQAISGWLPFQFFTYQPTRWLMGNIDDGSFFQVLSIQLVWIGLLILLCKWIWKKGLQTYTAFGS